jgi:predicted nucleic acid-binding protein
VAVEGWVVEKSASARGDDPDGMEQLLALAGRLYICPIGELELLYSVQSARDHDLRQDRLRDNFHSVAAPADIFERALRLQRDPVHHHEMWRRLPIPDPHEKHENTRLTERRAECYTCHL